MHTPLGSVAPHDGVAVRAQAQNRPTSGLRSLKPQNWPKKPNFDLLFSLNLGDYKYNKKNYKENLWEHLIFRMEFDSNMSLFYFLLISFCS